MSTQSVLVSTLLALQLCLGFWQIMKLTPAGALIHCSIEWCLIPLGMSSFYARLKKFPGRIFKTARCFVTTAADQPPTMRGDRSEIRSSYLGVEFHLERKDDNRLLLNKAMAYYITHKIWHSLLDMAEVAPYTVFLKGYKEFWQDVASGGVMTFEEVLDSLILDNHAIRLLDNHYLLPVNLSVAEEKLLKVLNLVGLFLQTKKVHWLIPLLLSFTAALLEFSTSLRVWLYARINALFCHTVRVICDRLPRGTREQVYSLGFWVENLKPGNDIEIKVVRGNICAVIGGGAKVNMEGAILVQPHPLSDAQGQNIGFPCEPIREIACSFDEAKGKSTILSSYLVLVEVECRKEEFERLVTLLETVARNRSGTLRSCSAKNVVRVRSLRETVIHYAKSGFPSVYEIQLQNTIVK